MSKNVRDTHFAGFAQLVWDDLDLLISELCWERADRSLPVVRTSTKKIQKIIAQRAYDLLVHDRLHTGTSDLQSAGSTLEAEDMVHGVPDLRDWPTKNS